MERSNNIYLKKCLLVIFDVVAINVASYVALIMRFYVAYRFLGGYNEYRDKYIDYFAFYTIFCLFVFMVFNMYKGNVKYAGYNDLINVFYANIIILLLHFVVTIAIGYRMPISFYLIQIFVQFILTSGARLSYRICVAMADYFEQKSKGKPRAMIIGVNETCKMVIKRINYDKLMQPVCVLNVENNVISGLFDGLPIENGLDLLDRVIDRYKIDCAVIATELSDSEIQFVYAKSSDKNVIVQDYTTISDKANKESTFVDYGNELSEKMEVVMIDDRHILLKSGNLTKKIKDGRYTSSSMLVRGDIVILELCEEKQEG